MTYFFNPIVMHRTPADAWNYAMQYISNKGDNVKTEDGKLTKEVMNLVLTVRDHNKKENWPIPRSGWTMAALQEYAAQLLDPDVRGFDYTYGNRLRSYVSFDTTGKTTAYDQIERIISKLKANETTRRAVAITWYPEDIMRKHVPCMVMNEFLARNGALNLTAVFRSHDIARAWPANMFGLSRMLQIVADACGLKCGTVTTMSVSAHIYL